VSNYIVSFRVLQFTASYVKCVLGLYNNNHILLTYYMVKI